MRSRRQSAVCVLVVLCGLALAAGRGAPVHAQSAADLFNRDVIHDVRVTIHPRDLALLRANFQLNTWYPATLHWGSLRVRDAAVRSRGLGSRNPVKLGLEVDFDRYVKGRRVLGLSSLVLDNLWQDKSLVREPLALAMFERLGLAASRAAFARVFINNEFQGLYSLVEPIDTEFLGRAYQDPGGYLFEYKWLFDFRAQYLGDALAPYLPIFEARAHELAPPETLWGPLRDLFRVANEADDASWRAEVGARLDLEQLIRYLAVEGYIAENDGFVGYAGMNNKYWYRPSGADRHQIIPWDKDFAFTFLTTSIFREVDTNVIVRRALAEPDLYALFLDTIEQCLAAATQEDWFANELERIVTLIQPVVEADTRKQFSTEDFFAEIDFLREFARRRPEIVRDELAISR
jgi:spore coat protein CotH